METLKREDVEEAVNGGNDIMNLKDIEKARKILKYWLGYPLMIKEANEALNTALSALTLAQSYLDGTLVDRPMMSEEVAVRWLEYVFDMAEGVTFEVDNKERTIYFSDIAKALIAHIPAPEKVCPKCNGTGTLKSPELASEKKCIHLTDKLQCLLRGLLTCKGYLKCKSYEVAKPSQGCEESKLEAEIAHYREALDDISLTCSDDYSDSVARDKIKDIAESGLKPKE